MYSHVYSAGMITADAQCMFYVTLRARPKLARRPALCVTPVSRWAYGDGTYPFVVGKGENEPLSHSYGHGVKLPASSRQRLFEKSLCAQLFGHPFLPCVVC